MARHKFRSTLLRLIEAGQLTRHALVAPLRERGLEPGDDIVLSEVATQPGRDAAALAEALGLPEPDLHPMIDRLVARDLVAMENEGVVLTERGNRLNEALAAASLGIEAQLLAGLGDKHRKSLDRSLRAIIATLARQ
jgi:DNA-binding MarR family transcriptional regulator